MRRGCISLGEIKCDECGTIIPHPDRYLVVDEKDGVEDEEGEPRRYCVACAEKKGYTHSKEEKGENILTFFEQ
ncbi:MAG: hypothetical protein ABID87_01765 [Chloroflexota bacterium]